MRSCPASQHSNTAAGQTDQSKGKPRGSGLPVKLWVMPRNGYYQYQRLIVWV